MVGVSGWYDENDIVEYCKYGTFVNMEVHKMNNEKLQLTAAILTPGCILNLPR